METYTPERSSFARHSRIIGVDTLPSRTPPKWGLMCLPHNHV